MKIVVAFFVTVLNFAVLIVLGVLLRYQFHAQIPIAVEFVFLGFASVLVGVNVILMLTRKKQTEIDM